MQLSRGQRRWLAAIAVLLIGGFFHRQASDGTGTC